MNLFSIDSVNFCADGYKNYRGDGDVAQNDGDRAGAGPMRGRYTDEHR